MNFKTGTGFHMCARIIMDDSARFTYGSGGGAFADIEGQENDFTAEYSSFNQNSTSVDFGAFPHLLYGLL
jgi:hypothetical protein